uniref:Uncharacterized protein n=1 Tax=Amphiprion percula TaxID=161767 RepID=A0A3P8TLD3_AMPPE
MLGLARFSLEECADMYRRFGSEVFRQNPLRGPATSTSLRAKISNLICSATDTEGVHTLLDDLLAPNVYFRFNPMLSAQVSLDENRPGALDLLQRDTQNYLERNRNKLARLCLVLGAERSSLNQKQYFDGLLVQVLGQV